MTSVKIGLTIFFSFIFPVGGLLLESITGGMYGPIFRELPHPVYLSLNIIAIYLIPFVIALLFIKYTNLKERLPSYPPSRKLFIIGTILILLPQFLRIWTSTIQGGGASFALMSYAAPFIFVAKVMIFAGAIKLFMAVKPSEEYEYDSK